MLIDVCANNGIFIHPALRLMRRPSIYRDHAFVLHQRVQQYAPLLAIPIESCIGFKLADNEDHVAALGIGTGHGAERAASSMQTKATDEDGDTDVTGFFFKSIGLVVNDLLIAHNNAETDSRHIFAKALLRARCLQNAPYIETSAFSTTSDEPSMAEVSHQMIHNYIQSGPLTGKVDRNELLSALSLSLSHSTALKIGDAAALGIIPLVHMLPHGEHELNAVLMASPSTARENDAVHAYFKEHCPVTGGFSRDTQYIYVIATQHIEAGHQIATQPMAPACGVDAADMWKLASGAPPPPSQITSYEYQLYQKAFSAEFLCMAENYLAKKK